MMAKQWFEIWLIGSAWDGGEDMLLARVRSVGLAKATRKMWAKTFYTEAAVVIR